MQFLKHGYKKQIVAFYAVNNFYFNDLLGQVNY